MTLSETEGAPSIREAHPADQSAVLDLIGEYYAFDGIAFNRQQIAEGLAVLLSEPSLGRVLLAQQGADPVGYLVLTFGFDLEFGGRQATVTDLFLRPQARGLRIGTALLQAAEQLCSDLEILALELQVEHENRAARAFYQHLGFESHDRIPMSKRLARANVSPALPPEVLP